MSISETTAEGIAEPDDMREEDPVPSWSFELEALFASDSAKRTDDRDSLFIVDSGRRGAASAMRLRCGVGWWETARPFKRGARPPASAGWLAGDLLYPVQ